VPEALEEFCDRKVIIYPIFSAYISIRYQFKNTLAFKHSGLPASSFPKIARTVAV
jgi:hypothetical protein